MPNLSHEHRNSMTKLTLMIQLKTMLRNFTGGSVPTHQLCQEAVADLFPPKRVRPKLGLEAMGGWLAGEQPLTVKCHGTVYSCRLFVSSLLQLFQMFRKKKSSFINDRYSLVVIDADMEDAGQYGCLCATLSCTALAEIIMLGNLIAATTFFTVIFSRVLR